VLEKVSAFRQTEQFESFLLACKADSRGRLGYEDYHYPQVEFYLDILAECKKINIQRIIAEGYKGTAIKQQLRRQRLSAIHAYQKKKRKMI
jgi:tRNA nucleotidyltransferase (CCA-adding enzyme)